MNRFMVDCDAVLGAARADLPAEVIGTWLRLLAAAHLAEKLGRLPGAASFTDRALLVLAHVTRKEVAAATSAGLVTKRGRDLVITGYDMHGQRVIEAKRRGGDTRAAAPRTAAGTLARTATRTPGSSGGLRSRSDLDPTPAPRKEREEEGSRKQPPPAGPPAVAGPAGDRRGSSGESDWERRRREPVDTEQLRREAEIELAAERAAAKGEA